MYNQNIGHLNMKTKHDFTLLSLIVTFLFFALLAGCAPQVTPVEGTEREQVVAKTEPMADNLYQAMVSQDYAAFSKDFDPQMKKAMDEKAFQQMLATLDPKIGKYQSRQLQKVEKVQGLYVLTYLAKFENEDNVTSRISFRPGDPMQVSGLWFNSPKLSGK